MGPKSKNFGPQSKYSKETIVFWEYGELQFVKNWRDFRKLLRPPLIQFSKLNDFLWVCWFLGKNIFNFVPPFWKLHNLYCHSMHNNLTPVVELQGAEGTHCRFCQYVISRGNIISFWFHLCHWFRCVEFSTFVFNFWTEPACRKQQTTKSIQNSKFNKSKSMSYQGHLYWRLEITKTLPNWCLSFYFLRLNGLDG